MSRNSKSVGESLIGWFSHPVVGITGTVASIVSISLAVWLYVKTVPSREIAVMEPPIRSVFLSKDAPDAIDVRIHGEPTVDQDVFALQMVLWNYGNQNIRPENVLGPIAVSIPPGTELVYAKVLRKAADRTIKELGLAIHTDIRELRAA